MYQKRQQYVLEINAVYLFIINIIVTNKCSVGKHKRLLWKTLENLETPTVKHKINLKNQLISIN